MNKRIRLFLHYWLSGIVLGVWGGATLMIAFAPTHLFSQIGETGAMTIDSWWWKSLIVLAKVILIPFLFGWLLYTGVTAPNGFVRPIISGWLAEKVGPSPNNADDAEHDG